MAIFNNFDTPEATINYSCFEVMLPNLANYIYIYVYHMCHIPIVFQ